MPQPSVQKAKIVNLNTKKEVTCHFNPAEFELAQSLSWNEETSIGDNTPKLSYKGGRAQDMTVTLLFDTTDKGGKKDVRKEYKALVEMAQVDTKKKNTKTGQSEPPQCRFQWGKFLAFNAVITNLKQKFTMFTANGTPVRAEVVVTFKQVGVARKPQNPTSRSQARRVWLVEEGQRLDWIAYQEYGNSAEWRHIAETNNLDNPFDLRPGQVLKLTPLPSVE
ncbi:MAG: LysM peptidoglycan-binding domain-containing protein [Anaerolineales bacterium]|nr:LysM peptidoglycan-binding domain-containing protein [Anaerolineales bacterium]